jgi:two-component system sensor histidine kinase KdpD
MREGGYLAAALLAVAANTYVQAGLLHVTNAATVSTSFLLIVLAVAAVATLRVAVATSVASMLAFNFFFLPPVGTFTIADPQNWVALGAFLVVALIASHLSATARTRAREAVHQRVETARLFDLSRDVLMMTDSREALPHLARSMARRFDQEFVAIALPAGSDWEIIEGGAHPLPLETRELAAALAAAEQRIEFDAYQRTYAGHRQIAVDGRTIRLVPLRAGTRPVGLLAASGPAIEPGLLDALAGVVALAVERARFFEERKEAELTRRSDELKTALLASLGHDLRTPLTAIRLAAVNLISADLSPGDRAEQAALIHAEVERLSRLFNNVLEMAKIDAGAVAASTRATHPSEIVAAARDRVAQALSEHAFETIIDDDHPVPIDPQLTAAALAHVLENAAQYTPQGTAVTVRVARAGDHLEIRVIDRGPGISAADLPHLFDRFYRGAAARARSSGTGMGLWIARGLLAAEDGRIWAENNPDGGSTFTIAVPVNESLRPSGPQAPESSTSRGLHA